jgi:hypothetical protein
MIDRTPEQQVVHDIKQVIGSMSEDSQTRVTCIASTLRNILKADPQHAGLALALVGAEQAAID